MRQILDTLQHLDAEQLILGTTFACICALGALGLHWTVTRFCELYGRMEDQRAKERDNG